MSIHFFVSTTPGFNPVSSPLVKRKHSTVSWRSTAKNEKQVLKHKKDSPLRYLPHPTPTCFYSWLKHINRLIPRPLHNLKHLYHHQDPHTSSRLLYALIPLLLSFVTVLVDQGNKTLTASWLVNDNHTTVATRTWLHSMCPHSNFYLTAKLYGGNRRYTVCQTRDDIMIFLIACGDNRRASTWSVATAEGYKMCYARSSHD